jgi:hypothetical protein
MFFFWGISSVKKTATAVPVGQNAPAAEYVEMAKQFNPPPPPLEPNRRILLFAGNGALIDEYTSSGALTYLPGPVLQFFDANNKRKVIINGTFVIEELLASDKTKTSVAKAPSKRRDKIR